MKEKILEGLKTKFEGVKVEILDRIATKAAKTITSEDDVTTYIEGVTFQTIIDANGDYRATEAQKSAVANYEKKHNIKDGKPVEEEPKADKDPEPKTKEDENIPAWAQALIASNKAMSERLESMDSEKTAKTRKSKLDDVLKNAPESIKSRYTKDFERFTFKDDNDFEEWLSDTKNDVEGMTTEFATKGGGFTPPKSGGNTQQQKEVSPLMKKFLEHKSKESSNSAIKGLN